MTDLFVYFKYHIAKNGVSMGEQRVLVVNHLGGVVKDLTYDEFKQMKGHKQVCLQKMKHERITGA